jgi:hypothetical protein
MRSSESLGDDSALFDPMMRSFLLIDFDPLGQRAKVIAAVAAAIGPHALAGLSWQTS